MTERMIQQILVTGPKDKSKLPSDYTIIDVTSRGNISKWTRLSPFNLGPCKLYWGLTAQLVENAWQYSKVYNHHLLPGSPKMTEDWIPWALQGFMSTVPDRYPVGRGAKPAFSYWAGRHLNYLEARCLIYVPLYVKAARNDPAFRELSMMVRDGARIALWDFDGYCGPITLENALNNTIMPLAHSFVIRAMIHEPFYIDQLVREHDRTL